jgi:hypothetical protein
MRDNDKVQHHSSPASTGLSGTEFLTPKSAGLNDPVGPENITTHSCKILEHIKDNNIGRTSGSLASILFLQNVLPNM